MTPEAVGRNARAVLARCAQAAERSGRQADMVIVIAACKTQPLELALAAAEAGVCYFGENRVQEAEEKWGTFDRGGLQLHMIGRLQRNKARRAVQLFDCIQSCDSLSLAERLAHVSARGTVPVMLEVNIGGEPSKGASRPEH